MSFMAKSKLRKIRNPIERIYKSDKDTKLCKYILEYI